QLMRALGAMGDRAAALAAYERCRQVLEAELGVEPDEETHALYEQIRTNKLQIADCRLQIDEKPNLQSKIYNLQSWEWSETPEPGHIYGREHEVAQVRRWLLEERCQLGGVFAVGGVV